MGQKPALSAGHTPSRLVLRHNLGWALPAPLPHSAPLCAGNLLTRGLPWEQNADSPTAWGVDSRWRRKTETKQINTQQFQAVQAERRCPAGTRSWADGTQPPVTCAHPWNKPLYTDRQTDRHRAAPTGSVSLQSPDRHRAPLLLLRRGLWRTLWCLKDKVAFLTDTLLFRIPKWVSRGEEKFLTK